MYRGVFETVAQTENKYAEDGKSPEYPSFGKSTSGFKEFYNFWGTFSTRMSFGWKEKYNLSEVSETSNGNQQNQQNAPK